MLMERKSWVYYLLIVLVIEKIVQHIFITVSFYYNIGNVQSATAIDYNILMVSGGIVGILFIVLFPIIEQLFKTIILNIGRFQKKRETTIYGLSLGLGFGSIFTPFSMITSNIQTSNSYLIVLVILGSIGIILLQGATGVCIGYGVYSGKLQKYFLLAIILHVPLTGLIFLTTLLNIEYLQIGLIIYGLIIYWYVTKNIMPKILSQKKSRKRGNIKTNS